MPAFTVDIGTGLCSSILSAAKNDGFENSLVNRARTGWFREQIKGWFAPGGLLCTYRQVGHTQLMRKFSFAEKHAQTLYTGRSHERDNTGRQDESNLPVYVRQFRDVFLFQRYT